VWLTSTRRKLRKDDYQINAVADGDAMAQANSSRAAFARIVNLAQSIPPNSATVVRGTRAALSDIRPVQGKG
jgi:hypothetical protein